MATPPRFRREPPPPALVYNTSMTTPDAALALAALWACERQRKIRVGGVCVTGGSYKAAVFCDLVNQYYKPGIRHGNDALAVGLAGIDDLPPDQALTAAPVDRRGNDGDAFYARSIHRIADTSLAESHLRNAMTFNAATTVVLSAPATSLAASLRIVNNRDILSEPVQRLILVDSRDLYSDPESLDFLLQNWPTEIAWFGGDNAPVLSSARLEEAFSWAEQHPVVDALRAHGSEAYEIVARDLAAVHFAIETDAPGFELSEPGELSLAQGSLEFAVGTTGSARQLRADGTAELTRQLLAAATANPN